MKSVIKLLALLCFPLVSSPTFSQDERDVAETQKVQFSGTINMNTNGISPVPAFSLDKPSIIGTFSLERKRINFNPEIAFSTTGQPWFINPRITYKAIDRKKFDFSIGTIYSLSYSYPEELINNNLEARTKIEHYALLQSTSAYALSENFSVSLATYHGFGLSTAPIKRGNFFVFGGNIDRVQLGKHLYYSIFSQLTYINLDSETDGIFASSTFGVGHKNWPLILSTQLSQPLVTNIAPEPSFKWNVGLTYNF